MSAIILTGSPGVGKTTLIKRIADDLKGKSIDFTGFYTEDIRDTLSNKRIGFDVVTFNGVRGKLARSRASSSTEQLSSRYKVGQYNVFVNDFEKVVLPVFASKSKLIIIDEIGSMELFSNKFENYMANVLNELKMNSRSLLIATVPILNRRNNRLIELLKSQQDNFVHLKLTKENRKDFYPIFNETCHKILNKEK